jgi:hypothetical protein
MLNCCILGPNWIFNLTERSIDWIRYIMEGTNVKIRKVFAGTGAITTLQNSGGNSTPFLSLGSEGKKMISGQCNIPTLLIAFE